MARRIAFEWKTRVIDFTTEEEAKKCLNEYETKYNVCHSQTQIYRNSDSKYPYSLEILFTSKDAKISCGW